MRRNAYVLAQGILSGGAAGSETMFVIQAASNDGKFRDTGGDEFTVSIRNIDSGVNIPFDLSDGDDGRYMVTYTIPDDEAYEISINFEGLLEGLQAHCKVRLS